MNVKTIFGALLTVLGIGALLYAAILFINLNHDMSEIKGVVISSLLGALFFVSGIGLIRSLREE